MPTPSFVAPPASTYHSRREFLQKAGSGFGLLALAGLLEQQRLLGTAAQAAEVNPLAPKRQHFPAKAKAVIWLFMNGGPSHVDTWDYKPELEKRHGQTLKGFDNTTGFFADQVGPLMKSPFQFKRHGQSGTWVSELFPHTAKHVDRMAFLYSCWTDSNNHSPALFKINTGMSRMGFPCVGAWVTYGLGTESQNLPAFVTMYDTLGRGIPKGHAQNWGAGFLPGVYQGTALRPQGAPIDNLAPPADTTPARQRAQLDLLAKLNRRQADQRPGETELSARIESFELAYRMQMAAPEALDLTREPAHIQKLYGLDNPKSVHFAKQVLVARRLVERGVRFVNIFHASWDHHSNLNDELAFNCGMADRPIAALLKDLKQRGLLDSTLVLWVSEFGRTPLGENRVGFKDVTGRDHHPFAFSLWLAGGGVKGGQVIGKTDEIGWNVVEDPVHVNDYHATILHLFGLDHLKLTYRFQGRDFRLTDVGGKVVPKVLA
jgi:hypothetical protein